MRDLTARGSIASPRRGLIDRDREAGSLVAVEFWRASERLPKELLEALPEPEAKGVVVTREDMAKRQPA